MSNPKKHRRNRGPIGHKSDGSYGKLHYQKYAVRKCPHPGCPFRGLRNEVSAHYMKRHWKPGMTQL